MLWITLLVAVALMASATIHRLLKQGGDSPGSHKRRRCNGGRRSPHLYRGAGAIKV